MSNWNMPPGVSTNDIPGNTPDDEATEDFWNSVYAIAPSEIPEEVWETDWFHFFIVAVRDMAFKHGYEQGMVDAGLVEEYEKMKEEENDPGTL